MASSGAIPSRPSILAYVLGGLALAVLLAMSIFFFAAGLMAPLWAVIVFSAVWLMIFILGCRLDSAAPPPGARATRCSPH